MEEQGRELSSKTDTMYLGSLEDVLSVHNVDQGQGLSSSEVTSRQEQYGLNKLAEEEKTPLWKRFLEQFKDVLVIILLAAAIISGFLGDWIEAIIIMAIVIINAVLGVVQEGRAEQAVEALQKMSSPNAKVRRDGQTKVVPSEEIVPGDIVVIEAGDIVPADCRLIESSNLKVNESALTGESVPVEKDADFVTEETLGIGDRDNSLFSSTAVTYGRGTAIVTATGDHTEMGKIAGRISSMVQELTPLQNSLNTLGKYLAIFMLAVVAITFVSGVLRDGNVLDMFMTAVTLAVAAIPEGLSAVVTIVLALGMNRMATENAIVKRLLAVETLGSVDVICSDKTGTLTQNEMTVTKILADTEVFDVSGAGYKPEGDITNQEGQKVENHPVLDRLMTIASLCNEAQLEQGENDLWGIIGDPTEGAMLTAAGKYDVDRQALQAKCPRLGDLPFDSDRKMMSVFHDGFEEGKLALTKGAPDIVLERSTKEYTSEGVRELTPERKEEILQTNIDFAKDALRVLSFAYSEHPDGDFEDAEENLIFVGLMGMIDPARPEAKDAINICRGAGIRAVMITGDYKETAVAIANDLGLRDEEDKVLTGAEVEAMSEEELRVASEETSVYARVSPEHKVRIVEALQANGHIASMTGDGVNDAPALKRADIGVAMGITGTEVSKSAADMILTDDNFATIVNAVEEGRVIYSNIRKFVGFLLSCNVGEILVIFITILLMGPTMVPLLPIQLLWINLITDSFPALALGQEKAESDIMNQPPRRRTDKILNREMIASIVVQSIAIFASVFLAFNVGIKTYGYNATIEGETDTETVYVETDTKDVFIQADTLEGSLVPLEGATAYQTENNTMVNEAGENISFGPSYGAYTFAFITLILAELLRAFSSRSEHSSVFKQGFFSNPTMNKAILLSLVLTLVTIYIPGLNHIFRTTALDFKDWLFIILFSLIPFVVGEVFKAIFHRGTRKEQNS